MVVVTWSRLIFTKNIQKLSLLGRITNMNRDHLVPYGAVYKTRALLNCVSTRYLFFPLIVFPSAGFTPWSKNSHERGKGRVEEGKEKRKKRKRNRKWKRNKKGKEKNTKRKGKENEKERNRKGKEHERKSKEKGKGRVKEGKGKGKERVRKGRGEANK